MSALVSRRRPGMRGGEGSTATARGGRSTGTRMPPGLGLPSLRWLGSFRRPFGSNLHPVDSIYEPEGSRPPRFGSIHEPRIPRRLVLVERLLASVRLANDSVRALLGAGSFSPHLGSRSPPARSFLLRFGSGHARARSVDGRLGSFREPFDRGDPSIGSALGRSVRRPLGSVRSPLRSILLSLRTGARQLGPGSMRPRWVRRLLTLVRVSLPSRASRLSRGSSDPTAGSEFPRAES